MKKGDADGCIALRNQMARQDLGTGVALAVIAEIGA